MTSTEDTSFFIPSSTGAEDGGLLEELCETLILTIVMVLWKGVAGSDDEAWLVRSSICPFQATNRLLRLDSRSDLFCTALSAPRVRIPFASGVHRTAHSRAQHGDMPERTETARR